jgi:hypothetical protein
MSARYISMRVVFVLALALCICQSAISYSADAPKPLLKQGQPVDWWFVFKLNSAAGPSCAAGARRACIFGGAAGANIRTMERKDVWARGRKRPQL